MADQLSCPDAKILEKFSVGALAPGEADAVGEHVEQCERCIGTLHGVKVTDTLLDAMRRPAEAVEEPEAKLVEQLAHKISAMSAAGAKSSTQTLDETPPGSSPSVTVNLDEEARRRFEAAWLAGKPEPIEAILSADNVPHYLATLEELVHIEMEFRWRFWGEKKDQSARPTDIESYLVRFPRLDRPDIVERLVEQEFRVRRRHGDSLTRQEYQARFPNVNLSGLDEGEDVRSFLAPPEAPDELGRLGPYRVLKVLGRGGMGVVYMAEDPQLKRLVALKVMKPDMASRPEARVRFLREARAVAAFNHDHILSIFQVGEDRGVPFLAMPLLEGETLDDRLKREGRLPIEQVLRIGREIADGLAAAHSRGLIHRDIKPANVWLEARYEPRPSGSALPAKSLPHGRGSFYRVKIMDFGLARPVESDARLTQSGVIVGSPAYMAPEQARGERVDSAADLFSLGCLLYRACTGQLPFKAKDAMSTLLAVAMDTPTPPREVQPDVPTELSDFILKLLAKKPADRPASAQEVVEALAEIEEAVIQPPEKVPGVSQPAPSAGLHPPLAGRRRKVAVLAGLAALAACIVAGIVLYWPTPHGTVRIEINDPNIQVTFDKDGALIKGLLKEKDIPIRAGEHFLTVTHGKLTFDTKLFSVRKGETVAVKVEMLDGKLQVTHAGKVIGEPAPPGTTRWALEFDGKGSYVELPPFDFDAEKGFTIEAFINPAPLNDKEAPAILRSFDGKGGFTWNRTFRKYGGYYGFGAALWPNKEHVWEGPTADARIADGLWTHFAAVIHGKSLRFFVDGKMTGIRTFTGEPHGKTVSLSKTPKPSSIATFLGNDENKWAPFKGQICELRLSNTPRYTLNFVPAQRFQPDADTFALYHFDEGQGEVLRDSSGNNRHGKIVDANWVQVDVRESATPRPSPPSTRWALEFDGKKSYVELPPFDFDAEKGFTVEAFVNLAGETGYQAILRNQDGVYWERTQYLHVRYKTDDPKSKDGYDGVLTDRQIPSGVWTHFAYVIRGKAVRFFVNGKETPARQYSGGPLAHLPKVPKSARTPMLVGWGGPGAFAGKMVELRFSTIPRYKENFVPAPRLQADADTFALYHFDEGEGEVVRDASGNDRLGTIFGAKWVKTEMSETALKPSPPSGWYLEFDGANSYVEIPTLTRPQNRALTIETWARPAEPQRKQVLFVIGGARDSQAQINVEKNQWDAVDSALGMRMYSPLTHGEMVHLAYVTDAKESRFYVDGKLVGKLLKSNVNYFGRQTKAFLGTSFPAWRYAGLIGRTRISTVARYDADFTPAKRFEADQHTVAVYHLDEGQGDVLKDSSGKGHDGKIVGAKWIRLGETTTATQPPPTRWALGFDGKRSHVELPPLPFDGTKGLTFEAHVEVNDPARYQLLMKAIDVKGGFGWGVRNSALNLNLKSNIKGPISHWHGVQSNAKIAAGVQVHLAAVFDGKTMRIFQDGQEVPTFGVSGEPTPFAWDVFPGVAQPSSGPTYLGCWFESGAGVGKKHFFKGRIREIRVSNIPRYAKAFVPAARMRPDPATIVLYHCDEGQGDKLIDSSGHGRHGKIIDGSWVQITAEELRGTVVSPHRRVAEWVLQQGSANLVVLDDGSRIKAGQQLPNRPLKIAEVHFFAEGKPVTDKRWLDKLSELPDSLSGLWFFGYAISDGMLSRLTSLPATRKLQQLHMNFDVTVSDAGLKQLLSLSNLKHLSLVDTNVTNEGLRFIRDNLVLDGLGLGGLDRLKITQEGLAFLDSRLTGIGLAGPWATDSALEYVLKLPDLRSVSLSGVNTTDEGTKKLIQRFPKMTLLRLEGNAKVTAKVLPALASLQSLNYLDLNRFAVTDDDLKHLNGLKNLRMLLLTGTQVTPEGVRTLQKVLPACKIQSDFDVSSIDGDRQLAEWVLRQSNKNSVTFAGMPGPISSLDQLPKGPAKLSEIHLNGFEGPQVDLETFLARLQSASVAVTKLELSNQRFDDETLQKLGGLAQMKGLQDLRLRNALVTNAGLIHLRQFTKLSSLVLVNTHVTDDGIKFISNELAVRELELGAEDVKFTEDVLAHLNSRLEQLVLGGPWFGDTAIDHVVKLPNLVRLGFYLTPRLTNAGVARLLKHKPNLIHLYVSDCKVDDAVLPAIGALQSLRILGLHCPGFTNAGVERLLKSKPKLIYLHLSQSTIDDAILPDIAAVQSLRLLSLIACQSPTRGCDPCTA